MYDPPSGSTCLRYSVSKLSVVTSAPHKYDFRFSLHRLALIRTFAGFKMLQGTSPRRAVREVIGAWPLARLRIAGSEATSVMSAEAAGLSVFKAPQSTSYLKASLRATDAPYSIRSSAAKYGARIGRSSVPKCDSPTGMAHASADCRPAQSMHPI